MKGVLLVNLGSPESPSPKDVKTYLGEFLMDERVVDLPKLFRTILVKGIILNTRPKQSAKAYKKIWWDEGSPLIVLSERLQGKVSEKVSTPVSLAMRYGSMSIKKGLQELVDQGVDDIFIIPLYPNLQWQQPRQFWYLPKSFEMNFSLRLSLPLCQHFTITQIMFGFFPIQLQKDYKEKIGNIYYFLTTAFRNVTSENPISQSHIAK